MVTDSPNRGLSVNLIPASRRAVVHFVIDEGLTHSVLQADATVAYAQQTEGTELLK
jgi:hypothetical protein